jgi:hypothetical protein
MIKLRLGNHVINLVKDVKGSQRPGHLYCKRVPKATGGYFYYYRTENGKCGDVDNERMDYTSAQAKRYHPEHFTPLESKWIDITESAKNIIGFLGRNAKAIEKIIKNFMSDNRDSYHGYAWEAFYMIHKEIGSGQLRDINDVAEFLNAIYNESDKQKKAMIERFFNIYNAIKDIETSEFNGLKYMDSLWHDSGKMWNYLQANIEAITDGRPPDPNKWIVQPVSQQVGQDINGDYLLTHPDLPELLHAVSLKKIGEGGMVNGKEGTWDTGVIDPYVNSGVQSINKLGLAMKKKAAEIRLAGKKKGASTKDINKTISAAMAEMRHEWIFNNPDNSAVMAVFAIDQLHKSHTHAGATETVIIARVVRKDGSSYSRGVMVSKWNRALDKFVAKGSLSWQQNVTGTYKGVDGIKYKTYGGLSLYHTDTATGAKSKLAAFDHRSDNRHQIRMTERVWSKLAGDVDKANAAVANLIAVYDGLMPTKVGRIGYQASKKVTLFKSTQTLERKKMNAKYIRKELTESGKVRYIYRETQPRGKKVDEVTENRDKFTSLVDSADSAFESLFKDSVSEIDDVHFNMINAGVTSVRITNDVDTFLDVLGVPPKLRNKEEFTSASGSFNVSKGKMAFCMSNFPDDVSDIIKKAVMMHEVGHAYFYGALRIKHKKPLTQFDSKDKDQKKFFKDAAKFVDGFGKIDEEIRKKVEDEVTIADVKGKDKEALLLDTIKTYMVSTYATLSSEEHFAEAFSRYFIMPEQLKKKEKEVYEHFNEFFQKYGR